ncbi:homoserine dehydrogenase [Mitsuaria sp. 7]|uniref:homoserine dehydrogenase n=1 Tax=Mitsuaria sp. 7 TaxID=1658665 RepID=UPI0007DD58FE|nr:homoserine dehydrogenase [Mitsuaria sp. 7]ANH67223.1 homoserine dehydrogenase [Mitsuaria sp. 7]
MSRLNIAITGFGGIGRKVAELLSARAERYQRHYGLDVRIVGVCGSSAGLIDETGLGLDALSDRAGYTPGLTGDTFIGQVPADLLIEASPTDFRTGGAALGYLRTALRRQMHVIAISKGALVHDFPGLQALASRQGLALKVSGAAGSAMPIVDLVQYNLAGCEVSSLAAIVTGTTNIILSEMMDRECDFADALAEAQRLGVAESDPTLDTHGWDTACKIAILCSAAFGDVIDVQAMKRQGIDHVTLDDVRRWKSQGVVPRLVGRVDRSAGVCEASVGIELCGPDHPFAQAHGRTKAVHVVTDLMGDLTLVGGGSSPYGTAAAALKDLEHILRELRFPLSPRPGTPDTGSSPRR